MSTYKCENPECGNFFRSNNPEICPKCNSLEFTSIHIKSNNKLIFIGCLILLIGASLCNWYVNDLPEDNNISLQEENVSLQAFGDSVNTIGCTDPLACNYRALYLYDDGSCDFPEEGYDCEERLMLKLASKHLVV